MVTNNAKIQYQYNKTVKFHEVNKMQTIKHNIFKIIWLCVFNSINIKLNINIHNFLVAK